MKIIRFSQRGLVGYWRFDEETGSTAKDSSPYGNHGTIYGATRVRGIIGKALSFDGVDDYVEVPDSASLQDIKKITVVAWIYPYTGYGQEYPRIVEKGNVEPFRFYITASNGKLTVGLNTVSETIYRSNKTAIPENKWTMAAFTYDGVYLRIYLNGNLDKETTENAGDLDTFSTITHIGNFPTGNRTFNGIIDEVRIYNRALSPGEIKIIYAFTKYIKPHPIIMRRKL